MKKAHHFMEIISILTGILLLLLLSSSGRAQGAGRIVVAHDDWVLQDDAFHEPSDPGRFALNVAGFFTGGRTGKFLASSAVPSVDGVTLANVMTSAGHTWVISSSIPTSLNDLLGYDALFLCWDPVPDNNLLINYVNAGGSVYLAGYGVPSEDMLKWNPFLHHFGLGFTNVTTGSGDLPIESTHPIFAGVDYLFAEEGVSIVDLDSVDPKNKVVARYEGTGLFAVWDANATQDLVMSVRASQGGGLLGVGIERDLSRGISLQRDHQQLGDASTVCPQPGE